MRPAEYGAQLAGERGPLTSEQVEQAARIYLEQISETAS